MIEVFPGTKGKLVEPPFRHKGCLVRTFRNFYEWSALLSICWFGQSQTFLQVKQVDKTVSIWMHQYIELCYQASCTNLMAQFVEFRSSCFSVKSYLFNSGYVNIYLQWVFCIPLLTLWTFFDSTGLIIKKDFLTARYTTEILYNVLNPN